MQEIALIVLIMSIGGLYFLFIQVSRRASMLDAEIYNLKQIINRKTDDIKERDYDIEILITKEPDHSKHKDVIRKWTEKFHKRDNFTWAENCYKQRARPFNQS